MTTPFHHDLIFSLGVAWYVVAVFKLISLRSASRAFSIAAGRLPASNANHPVTPSIRSIRNLAAIDPQNEQPKRGREVVVLALQVDEANQLRHRHPATASDLFQALPELSLKGHARPAATAQRTPLIPKLNCALRLRALINSGITVC